LGLTKHEAQAFYETELDRIERAIRFACRRNGMSAEESEEFHGEAHVRLLADDHAILRALEDREAVGTYLAVVVQRLVLDFRASRWGRWRPSVAARRAGAVAVRLETLVVRDRLSFAEAFALLKQERQVEQSRDELYALLQSFPRRYGHASSREVSLPEDSASGARGPEADLEAAEHGRLEGALGRCLDGLLGELAAEDRLLLRMVFLDGHSVARVARTLGLEQKPLYRRLERIHHGLRAALEREGVDRAGLRGLLERRGVQQLDLREILDRYPSQESAVARAEPPRAEGP
jgi:RNA polymerase sigma factor for flagellar operon FliA